MASFVCFSSCSKDDDQEIDTKVTVTPTKVSMYYEETFQLSGTNVTKWESKDDFVAKVDSKGLVTGSHVGSTQIIASNSRNSSSIEVTIIPKYDLYDTPILEWGASMATIQSKETHTKKNTSSTSAMLVYDYSKNSNSCLLAYYFTNGKLSRIDIYMDLMLYVSIGNYLLERYSPLSVENDLTMFADGYTKDKMTTIIGLQTKKVSGTQLTYVSYISSNQ